MKRGEEKAFPTSSSNDDNANKDGNEGDGSNKTIVPADPNNALGLEEKEHDNTFHMLEKSQIEEIKKLMLYIWKKDTDNRDGISKKIIITSERG